MKLHQNGAIRYGTGVTAAGKILIAFSGRGLCALRLLEGRSPGAEVAELRRKFDGALFEEDQTSAANLIRQINAVLEGQQDARTIPLDLRGTTFQKKVWQALLQVPRGVTWSYSRLAQKVGNPRAVRAVASACARNPVGLVVPCHRILRNDGSLGGYGGGPERKRALLEMEKTR
jgi:AraC family transcriptional regulator of adaptative response/methylated-DNA-[protein]-cysteine methyltransferase